MLNRETARRLEHAAQKPTPAEKLLFGGCSLILRWPANRDCGDKCGRNVLK